MGQQDGIDMNAMRAGVDGLTTRALESMTRLL
jgi:hypothetical protein